MNVHIRGRRKKELKPWSCFQSIVQKVYISLLQKDSQSPLHSDHFSGGVKDLPKLQCVTSSRGSSRLAEEHKKPTEVIRNVNTAFAGNSWLQSSLQPDLNVFLSGQMSYINAHVTLHERSNWGESTHSQHQGKWRPSCWHLVSERLGSGKWGWLRTRGFGNFLQVVQISSD